MGVADEEEVVVDEGDGGGLEGDVAAFIAFAENGGFCGSYGVRG